jgi:hypothetical protein
MCCKLLRSDPEVPDSSRHMRQLAEDTRANAVSEPGSYDQNLDASLCAVQDMLAADLDRRVRKAMARYVRTCQMYLVPTAEQGRLDAIMGEAIEDMVTIVGKAMKDVMLELVMERQSRVEEH